MELQDKPTVFIDNPSLGSRLVPTERERYSRGISSRLKGDKVDFNRLELGSLNIENPIISRYITMFAITTPSNPSGNDVLFYHKSSGSDSKLYVLNSAGVELELATAVTASLDGAYTNGSIVNVDIGDVEWRLTGALGFKVTNAAGSTTRFAVTNTRTDIETLRINTAYTFPSADGSANQFIRTDGAGALSFVSLATLADGTYVRLDGTNDPMTGGLTITQAATTGTAEGSFTLTDGTHTTLTASTERHMVRINPNTSQQWATGAITTQRMVRIDAPTLAFVGASTVTDAMTVSISGAPIQGTNATLTSTHAFYIAAGAVGSATTSYGLTVNAQTGATNNYTAQFLGGETIFGGLVQATRTTKTISAGVITVTSSYTEVDTEASAATDDLDTINGGNVGDILILEAANDARTVVVKHGTGNIYLSGAGDRTLDDGKDKVMLIRHASTEWHEIAFSSNA